jgi:hypothetical protein
MLASDSVQNIAKSNFPHKRKSFAFFGKKHFYNILHDYKFS